MGGGQFLDFMGGHSCYEGGHSCYEGGHSCYEGGHRAHGGPPVPPLGKTLPRMAVFGRSAVVSPAFKTPFLMENNNKNNRTMEKTIEN